MKKIAIVYHELCLGGTSTSLLFLLDSLDYSAVSVDLILYKSGGFLYNKINKNVNILVVGKPITRSGLFLRSLFNGSLVKLFLTLVFRKGFFAKMRMGISQIGAKIRARKSALVQKNYDLVIGFMEFWPNEYSIRLRSKEKLVLIHQGYEPAHFNLFLDMAIFESVDKIGFVSRENCEKFNEFSKFAYKDKVIYFPNLLNANTIKAMAKEVLPSMPNVQEKCLLVTSARLNYHVKGLDRLLSVALALKRKGFSFLWVVLGSGEDERRFKYEIRKLGLSNDVICLGQQANPYSLVSRARFFVLLSRREGKPMAIDEAKILGKECIVTNYESAQEQILPPRFGSVVSNDLFSAEEVADLILSAKSEKLSSLQLDEILEKELEEKRRIVGKVIYA